MLTMNAGWALVLLAMLGFAPWGWADTPRSNAASAYAPGRIFVKSDGWMIYSPAGRRFVPRDRLRDVPAEIAPVVALLSGQPSRQTWGWTIAGAGQRVEVFEESNGFVISTSQETFYMHRNSDSYTISPGRPGVRRLTPLEAADIMQQSKAKQRQQGRR